MRAQQSAPHGNRFHLIKSCFLSIPRDRARPFPSSDRAMGMGILSCFIWAVAFIPALQGEAPRLLRIGTGGLSGVYYPIGKLIAQGITGSPDNLAGADRQRAGVPGYVGVAQSSGGSVANVRALAAGEIEAGLVQADVASWAYLGEGVFRGNESANVVRAVASLYPEKLQIVTRRDANIRSVADFRGKRISIDEIGSGTLAVMRTVLEAHGMSEADFSPVYLKPELTIERIKSGELDGFVVMAGAPMEAVDRVAEVGLSFVPLAPDMMQRIHARYRYLVPGEIPAGVYPGIPATPTLQVHALLVVHAAMPDELAYRVTASLWSEATASALDHGHPLGKSISLATALQGLSIPLHPGAERYYREKGMNAQESTPR